MTLASSSSTSSSSPSSPSSSTSAPSPGSSSNSGLGGSNAPSSPILLSSEMDAGIEPSEFEIRKKQRLEYLDARENDEDDELLVEDPYTSPSMAVFVTSFMGNSYTLSELFPEDTLDVLKMNLFEASGVAPENQILVRMSDESVLPQTSSASLKELDITDNTKLRLVLSMSGGPGSFMISSDSAIRRSDYLLEDELFFSSSEDSLNEGEDDDAGAETLEDILSSKTLIYRAGSGNIYIVEFSNANADVSFLAIQSADVSDHQATDISLLSEAPGKQHLSISQPALSPSSTLSLTTCFICGKKVRDALRYPCKCARLFCPCHKPPHLHNCSFDYCNAHKEDLVKSNPPVISSMLRDTQ